MSTKVISLICLLCIGLGIGIGYLIFNQKTQKNQFALLSKNEKDLFFLQTLGDDIFPSQAKKQMDTFIYKRDHNQLNASNLPVGTVYTSKEIISFLVRAYGYDRVGIDIDPTRIPDDNKGIALILGTSQQTDYRQGKTTCMLIATDFGTYSTTANAGRATLDNRVVNTASSVPTFAYDIGHTYP